MHENSALGRLLQQTEVHGSPGKALTPIKISVGKGSLNILPHIPTADIKPNSMSFLEQEVTLLKKNLSKNTYPKAGENIIKTLTAKQFLS